MAEKTVAAASGKQVPTGREMTRAQERYIQPPVDIYETPEGLVLLADMPGVAPSDLEVRLEENILTIQGKAKHAIDKEPIYREFELVNFFRQFQLSNAVDSAKITAEFQHGVLKLHLPKALWKLCLPPNILETMNASSRSCVAALHTRKRGSDLLDCLLMT